MFPASTIRHGLRPTVLFELLAACLAPVLMTSSAAYAALGGDITSVQADQVHMQGSMRATNAEGYSVQEIQGAHGIIVREYVSSAGKVFGVAWQGPWPPDLHQLLGSYFDKYVQAAQTQSASRRGHGPLVVELPDLVVQAGGHARAFVGRAYVPGLIPASVRAEVVQ